MGLHDHSWTSTEGFGPSVSGFRPGCYSIVAGGHDSESIGVDKAIFCPIVAWTMSQLTWSASANDSTNGVRLPDVIVLSSVLFDFGV